MMTPGCATTPSLVPPGWRSQEQRACAASGSDMIDARIGRPHSFRRARSSAGLKLVNPLMRIHLQLRNYLLAIAVSPLLAQPLFPQRAGGPATSSAYDSLVLAPLRWRPIGPNLGGRSVTVAGSVTRPYEYYMGTTGGGVFKTVNGGQTWLPITDAYFGGTIGSIAVSESNPDVVFVGTGEFDIRGNVSHGDGVFKSVDAGKTWTFVGLGDSRQISRVLVDPRDQNTVYVGVLGHVWGPNAERGVFKTTDGGRTWRKVLFITDSTGVTDLALDHANPNVLYAAAWDARRRPWQLISGGPESGIFKSTDGGEHWAEISRAPGLPGGLLGNIGLAISPAKPDRIWALIEADSGGVFRSDDAGASWVRTNADGTIRQRPWYFARIVADQQDPNTVYGMNVDLFRSTDGGRTFEPIRTPHADHHDLWIAPNDPQRMIDANDGGATVSIDGGLTWTAEGQPTGQFYHVITTADFPYRVCGSQQDRTSLCGSSRMGQGSSASAWQEVGGGESAYIAVRSDSPNVVFAGMPGSFTRTDLRTGGVRDINIWPDNSTGHAANDVKFRFQWTYPIVLSPRDPRILYAAAQVLFQSRNDGQSWTQISPDLTRHDQRTLGPSGGPITQDQTSVEYYGTIFAVAESPVVRHEIWVGSDDGLVHLTRDGGGHWTNVTPPDLPEWTRISIIEPSHFDAGTAYFAANRYQLDDYHPYLYKTGNYGRTWTRIVHGIPDAEFTRVILEDPARRGLLYAGTARGPYVSFDDGARWQTLRRNLPPVPVHDLAVSSVGDLVAATHGRGFWIIDDLSVLREVVPDSARRTTRLLKPGLAYRTNPASGGTPSAVISYWLASDSQVVKLDILDAHGAVVRSFSTQGGERQSASAADRVDADEQAFTRPSNHAGMNRFTWDLRCQAASGFPGMVLWRGLPPGPMVVPGLYRVRMTVAERSETRFLTVAKDPRATTTSAQYAAQFSLLIKIRDTLRAAHNAIRGLRDVRSQIERREHELSGANGAAVRAAVGMLLDSLNHVESRIYQVRAVANRDLLHYPVLLNDKIALLARVVENSDAGPTKQSYAVFAELTAQLDIQLREFRSALGLLVPINAFLRRGGLAPIVTAPAQPCCTR